MRPTIFLFIVYRVNIPPIKSNQGKNLSELSLDVTPIRPLVINSHKCHPIVLTSRENAQEYASRK